MARALAEADLPALLKLLATPLGRGFVAAENRVTAQVTGLWSEQTRAPRDKAVHEYTAALNAIATGQQGGKR